MAPSDKKERRRARLRQLIDDRFNGVQAAFEARTGVAASLVSRYLAGTKGMGEGMVERIEEELQIPGYFDATPGAGLAVSGSPEVVAVSSGALVTPGAEVVEIPQLDVVASMGSGITMPQHEDVVAVLQVHESGLRAQLGNTPVTSFKNLRLITAYGDSMAPTFQGGDVLLVDTGVYEVRLDAIYVMSYRGELFIKRLQRRPDGVLRMLSDNKNYDPIDIHNGQRDEFQALGRVLMAWNARKL